MEVVHAGEMQWSHGIGHRGDRGQGAQFKTLFTGAEASADNYWFTLVKIAEYSTPPHKHNFDQVRVMIEGGFGFGPQVQEEGTIGYFPEGTAYEQHSVGPSVTLLLQCANVSGARYLSQNETRDGMRAIESEGAFERGRFVTEVDGQRVERDAFEAIWEHATGEPIRYEQPRYERPVIMDPQNFRYKEGVAPGVASKTLGVFTERELKISFLRIDPGVTHALEAEGAEHLFYVMAGSGRAEERTLGPGAALRLRAGETGAVHAEDGLEILSIGLPR